MAAPRSITGLPILFSPSLILVALEIALTVEPLGQSVAEQRDCAELGVLMIVFAVRPLVDSVFGLRLEQPPAGALVSSHVRPASRACHAGSCILAAVSRVEEACFPVDDSWILAATPEWLVGKLSSALWLYGCASCYLRVLFFLGEST